MTNKHNCPLCGSKKRFEYASYSDYGWGTVEQHGFCNRCGYVIEQAYSPVCEGIVCIDKGIKDINGKYHAKNKRSRKRFLKKKGIKFKDSLSDPWCGKSFYYKKEASDEVHST